MPGTPPLGPAALRCVAVPTRRARRAISLLVLAAAFAVATALAGASPARAQASAACPAAGQPVGAAPSAAVEAAIVCLVNGERAARGLPPVARTAALERAAQRHASDMVARRYFAHVSPSGGTLDTRAGRAGYLTAPCWALGEDLARAPLDAASADAVVEAWMASPTHRAVILDSDFRDAGVGLLTHPPTGNGSGATFVLEMGALVPCSPGSAGGSVRAAPRARGRQS
jgi:uncharacterized protein YkwD